MATIDIKLKSYDELIFEITKLNTDKYLLEQENKQLKEQLEDTTTELFRANKKISEAIGYANERINYCCHNEIDATDWEEIFDILLGDKE